MDVQAADAQGMPGDAGALQLDARQRAMLLEMGVRVWWPKSPPTAMGGAVAVVAAQPMAVTSAMAAAPAALVRNMAPAPSQTGVAPAAEPATAFVPVADADAIALLDWPELARAVRTCTACGLCKGRKAAVFHADPLPAQADWLIVGEPPDEQDERAGMPFAGAAGALLDNMLRAVRCARGGAGRAGARVTQVVKCRPAVVRAPRPDELAQCAVFLRREIALSRPRVILAMGRVAALSLLGEAYPQVLQLPLGQLRGRHFMLSGSAVVVTYPPAKLLRAPQEKANAWADLCLARSLVDGPTGPTA